jgi:hypothetical protein
MADTRIEDYKTIEQGLRSRDPNGQRQAYIAKQRIDSESSETRRLRERLVDAHRHHDRGAIEEISRRLAPEGKRIKENVEKYYINRKGY